MKKIICDKCKNDVKDAERSGGILQALLNPPLVVRIDNQSIYGIESEYHFCGNCKQKIENMLYEVVTAEVKKKKFRNFIQDCYMEMEDSGSTTEYAKGIRFATKKFLEIFEGRK